MTGKDSDFSQQKLCDHLRPSGYPQPALDSAPPGFLIIRENLRITSSSPGIESGLKMSRERHRSSCSPVDSDDVDPQMSKRDGIGTRFGSPSEYTELSANDAGLVAMGDPDWAVNSVFRFARAKHCVRDDRCPDGLVVGRRD
jgi:hypothetical protein